jgi:hypothetical protein
MDLGGNKMDWLEVVITLAIGVLLGFLTGFVWPILRDRRTKQQKKRTKSEQKRRVLKDLDAVASEVMAAVQVQPHGIQNKDKWVDRLQKFAKRYDGVLGPLAGYVNRISYKIEDSTFDHASLGSPAYCCDQVEIDLALLRLCILPIVAQEFGWNPEVIEKEEVELLEKIWVNFQEISPPAPLGHPDPEQWYQDYKSQHLKQWHAQWKAYEFKIGAGENLAMAPYVNHERKAMEPRGHSSGAVDTDIELA